MAFPTATVDRIVADYQAGLSTVAIATALDCDPSLIRRALKSRRIKLRTRAAAAALALARGRRSHPTEGRQRTAAEKKRISDGVRAAAKRQPAPLASEYEREVAKRLLKSRTKSHRRHLRQVAAAGAAAARNGSKAVWSLRDRLDELNIDWDCRPPADILFTAESGRVVAIVVDGHYRCNWPPEKRVSRDATLAGMADLVVVIRNLSARTGGRVAASLLTILEESLSSTESRLDFEFGRSGELVTPGYNP